MLSHHEKVSLSPYPASPCVMATSWASMLQYLIPPTVSADIQVGRAFPLDGGLMDARFRDFSWPLIKNLDHVGHVVVS